jgi:hypothetical protein
MTRPSQSPQDRDWWARRQRRRQILAAGVGGGVACVVVVWSLTLWPGASLISGAVVGPVIAFCYKLICDYVRPPRTRAPIE